MRFLIVLVFSVLFVPLNPAQFGSAALIATASADSSDWRRHRANQYRNALRLQAQQRALRANQRLQKHLQRDNRSRVAQQRRVNIEAKRAKIVRAQLSKKSSLKARLKGDYGRMVRVALRTKSSKQYLGKYSARSLVANRFSKTNGLATKKLLTSQLRNHFRKDWIKFHDDKGGHIRERHIAKSQNYLRNRINSMNSRRETNRRVSMVSSFSNQRTAQRAISGAIRQHRRKSLKDGGVRAWLRSPLGGDLKIKYTGQTNLGYGALFNGKVKYNLQNATVILRKDNKGGYYVLTAYPE